MLRAYPVDAAIKSESLEAILCDDEFLSLLQTVLDNSEVVLNNQSNYVGRLSDEAESAEIEIERYLQSNADCYEVCDASDWVTVITDKNTAESLRDEALSEGVWLMGDIDEAIERLRGGDDND